MPAMPDPQDPQQMDSGMGWLGERKAKGMLRRGQISLEAAKRHLGRRVAPVTHTEDNADLQAAGDHSWGDRGL
jgi:hypothetical protein